MNDSVQVICKISYEVDKAILKYLLVHPIVLVVIYVDT